MGVPPAGNRSPLEGHASLSAELLRVMTMVSTLEQLNAATHDDAAAMLDGLYAQSPWIARQALRARPFRSLAQLQHQLRHVVDSADADTRRALIRSQPELSDVTDFTPDALTRLQQLRAHYSDRFGFRSSWPGATRAASRSLPSRSSTNWCAAWTTRRTSNTRKRCAAFTAWPRSGWAATSASISRQATTSGTGTKRSASTAIPATPKRASSPSRT
ncbi:hypothetical protein G6F31_017964 [Rhizopus arrhizus]|nr:hypothetical protein G6F31_017964 [Rhizopus arrhizus]